MDLPEQKDMNQDWQACELEDSPQYWQVGPLHVWAKRVESEWQLAIRRGHDIESLTVDDSVQMPTDPKEWMRFSAPDNSRRITLRPAMPDRPVIVRPEAPLTIISGTECLIYVLLPCWVQVLVGVNDVQLTEIPSVILSNSWFGQPDEGVLCYGMRTTARSRQEELPSRRHQAFCPVRIQNKAAGHLEFSRLCLRVSPLCIYADNHRLWTNEVRFQHFGEDKFSQLDYGRESPAECSGNKRLGEARDTRKSWFSLSRFKGLKSLIH